MTARSDALLLRLIGQVYDAALDPERWPALVDAIKQAVGGSASVMLHYDGVLVGRSVGNVGVSGLSGYEQSALSTYNHYASIDTRTPLVAAMPVGGVYVDDRDFGFGTVMESEIFHEFFRPLSLGHGMAANLFRDDSRMSAFSVHRHLKDGAFSPEAVQLFEALAPHVTRALQIHRQAALLRIERDGATQALDELAAGLIVVDRNARVLWANGVGEGLLCAGDGLGAFCGRLTTSRPDTTQALHAQIAQAVATAIGTAAQAGEVLRLERHEARRPLAVLVCPLRPDEPLFQRAVPAALVLVNDPDRRSQPRPETLAKFYGLTLAQANLLTALVDGRRIADYANEKGISMNTAKSHLQRIFERTGQSRQSDLVREVLTNPVFRARSEGEPRFD